MTVREDIAIAMIKNSNITEMIPTLDNLEVAEELLGLEITTRESKTAKGAVELQHKYIAWWISSLAREIDKSLR